MKKVLIVGGVAGGATAAVRIRRLDEKAEIIMFEKGPRRVLFQLFIAVLFRGVVESKEKLVLMTPESFKTKYNIEARVNQEVIRIHREEKTVEIKNLETNEVYKESYDVLILSPGANPVVPPFEGSEPASCIYCKKCSRY